MKPGTIKKHIALWIVFWIAACAPQPAVTPTALLIDQATTMIATDEPPTSTPTVTATATETPVPAPPTQALDLAHYAQACQEADRLNSEYERQYALEQLIFSTDLGLSAQAQLKSAVIVSPSCNVRLDNIPQYIVLHATRGGLIASLSEFQGRGNSSAHYLIDRDGQIYQLVPEKLVAFHVTCCIGQGGRVMPDYTQSVGIELVNKLYVNPADTQYLIYEDFLESFGYRYWEDYPQEQLDSLVVLVLDVAARWGIPMDRVIGHYQVNDTVDPGPALNLFWRRNGNPPHAPIFATP